MSHSIGHRVANLLWSINILHAHIYIHIVIQLANNLNGQPARANQLSYRGRLLSVGLQICCSRLVFFECRPEAQTARMGLRARSLSGSTYFGVRQSLADAEKNMCINLKNLNLLGSCSLVRWCFGFGSIYASDCGSCSVLWFVSSIIGLFLVLLLLLLLPLQLSFPSLQRLSLSPLYQVLFLASSFVPSPARLFFVVVTLLFIQRHGPPIDRAVSREHDWGCGCGNSCAWVSSY